MSLDWGNWLYGLWVAVIGGASNGVVAGLGLNLMDPKDFNAQQSRFWYMVGGLFLLAAGKDFFIYLAQHPAPAIKTTTEVTGIKTVTAPTGETTVTTLQKTTTVETPAAPPLVPPAPTVEPNNKKEPS
jgi:hypothetical protein